MIDLIIPTLSQGLLWSLLALGVYITFRVLDFADMTVEGSFPLGAAICVYFLIRDHHPCWPCLPLVFWAALQAS